MSNAVASVASCKILVPTPPVFILFPLLTSVELAEIQSGRGTAALHNAGARSAHASKMAKLLECVCLFWRFSLRPLPIHTPFFRLGPSSAAA